MIDNLLDRETQAAIRGALAASARGAKGLNAFQWTLLGLAVLCGAVAFSVNPLIRMADPQLAVWANRIHSETSFIGDYADPWGREWYHYRSFGPNRIDEAGGGDDITLGPNPPLLALVLGILPGALLALIPSLVIASLTWTKETPNRLAEGRLVIALAAIPALYLAYSVAGLKADYLSPWPLTLASPHIALGGSLVLSCFVVALAVRLRARLADADSDAMPATPPSAAGTAL